MALSFLSVRQPQPSRMQSRAGRGGDIRLLQCAIRKVRSGFRINCATNKEIEQFRDSTHREIALENPNIGMWACPVHATGSDASCKARGLRFLKESRTFRARKETGMRRFGPHYALVVVAVIFFALLAAAGVRSTPGVLLVPWAVSFHWSRSVISFAAAVGIF